MLIENARQWWKLWSAQLLGLAAIVESTNLLALLGVLPRGTIPAPWGDVVMLTLVVLAFIARFVRQKKLEAARGQN